MYIFIGGTPTSGKTFTSKKFIKESRVDIFLVSLDDLRKDFLEDPKLEYWVNFFSKQNEAEYWKTITYEKGIQELVKQSEAFWPRILKTIQQTIKNHKHAIFEGVNILPHLANKDIDFPGFFLVCDDYQTVLERNIKDPRWGKSRDMQELEAKYFIEHDVRFIKEESKKYNYKVFNNPNDLFEEMKKLFK